MDPREMSGEQFLKHILDKYQLDPIETIRMISVMDNYKRMEDIVVKLNFIIDRLSEHKTGSSAV